MKEYEEKLKQYIKENNIKAEQVIFEGDVKTSEKARIKTNSLIVKTIVFIDLNKSLEYGNGVIAIVPGESRVDKNKLRKISNSKVKIASSDEVLILTSYPAGGVPPFGFKARFYLDKSLKNKNEVYAGGGSIRTLIKTIIKEIIKANKAEIVNIIENLDNNLIEQFSNSLDDLKRGRFKKLK
ncbi:MAG: YbaK/EbsC family protein [Nanoarchaeota archaeon]